MPRLERLAAYLSTHVCKARIGFICGKYEADFWYYELLEMTRKTGLMAVTSFLQTGSYTQLLAKLFISCFFFGVLFRCSPFNSPRLDLLVTTSQVHPMPVPMCTAYARQQRCVHLPTHCIHPAYTLHPRTLLDPWLHPRCIHAAPTLQFCTLATLFFALMTKIGFFVEEASPP